MAEHVDVDLLAGLAVTGDSTDEEVVAFGGDCDGVVSSGIGVQGDCGIT